MFFMKLLLKDFGLICKDYMLDIHKFLWLSIHRHYFSLPCRFSLHSLPTESKIHLSKKD